MNPRPPGYGPSELPDCSILLYRRVSPASMRIKGGSSRRLNAFGFHYTLTRIKRIKRITLHYFLFFQIVITYHFSWIIRTLTISRLNSYLFPCHPIYVKHPEYASCLSILNIIYPFLHCFAFFFFPFQLGFSFLIAFPVKSYYTLRPCLPRSVIKNCTVSYSGICFSHFLQFRF